MADIELVVIDENTTTRRFADELRYNAVVRKFTEGLR
jgi:L-arabinose isomerase